MWLQQQMQAEMAAEQQAVQQAVQQSQAIKMFSALLSQNGQAAAAAAATAANGNAAPTSKNSLEVSKACRNVMHS